MTSASGTLPSWMVKRQRDRGGGKGREGGKTLISPREMKTLDLSPGAETPRDCARVRGTRQKAGIAETPDSRRPNPPPPLPRIFGRPTTHVLAFSVKGETDDR